MNIQRYDLEPGSESMQRFPDGDYVLHTDHLEAVEQARADALRWVLELISPIKIDAENNYDQAVLSMIALVNEERARLRARLRELIAAQRGEVEK